MKTGWKRLLSMLTMMALTGALLAGCSGSTQAPAAASTAAEENSTAAEEKSTAAEEASSVADSAQADGAASEAEEPEAEEEDEEDYTTGDASLDDPRNADDIGEQELLVVSFGTSFNDSRRLTIGAIEGALEDAFPDWSVRRAFTSQIIIDHIEKRDGVKIDNVTEALDRAVENGVKKLVVQPTHLMSGFEYNDLVDELAGYSDAFEQVAIGEPLLTSDADFDSVAEAIVGATEQFDDGNTAICFMGHGTEADSNSVYAKMQDVLTGKGYENYYIGTVEAEPAIDDVMEAASAGAYTSAVLRPLMIVAGDHANNDMAGDEEDSWKSILTAEGYNVECVIEGLGSLEDIQQMFVAHAQTAIDTMN
ncbi:MAG: sirohydrochlorin cobaltochelatase [Lachnospiraceae bacterium]|nr:sirohydrochlorin cobaltochelatase [Lachnospiraceae bacterium]